jgi:hypothetical protein
MQFSSLLLLVEARHQGLPKTARICLTSFKSSGKTVMRPTCSADRFATSHIISFPSEDHVCDHELTLEVRHKLFLSQFVQRLNCSSLEMEI